MLREIFTPVFILFCVIVLVGEAYTDMKKQRDDIKENSDKEVKELVLNR